MVRLGLLEVAAVTGWGKGGRRPFEPVAPTLQDKASVPVDKTLLPEHPLCRGTAALRQGLAGSALPEPEPKSASCGASAVGLSQVPLNAFAPCSRATPPQNCGQHRVLLPRGNLPTSFRPSAHAPLVRVTGCRPPSLPIL